MKAYKSEIYQDILSWAAMSSWINLLTWNDDQIWQDWTIWGRQMNIWRTTSWADRVQQISTSPNLTYFTAVLELLDKQTTIDSWINPLEQIDPISDKVWVAEIMEANKAIRNRSLDENYNIWLDEALTMTLARIKQFAPSLLSEKVLDSEWKVIKTIFPKITIQWYEVTKEDWKQVFTENLGKFWYFELKPDTIQWIGVKVTTSSTNSMLPILERQRITEYVNNMVQLWQLAQIDPTIAQKMQETIKFDELISWMSDAYGYDTKLKANTEKDKKIMKQKKAILEMTKKLTLNYNPIPNETIWWMQEPMEQGQELWQPTNPIQQITGWTQGIGI